MEGLGVQVTECNHSIGNDPRRAERNECVKCGKIVPDGWVRDPAFEESLIRMHHEDERLCKHVYDYMVEGAGKTAPIRDLAHRPFVQKEAPEEYRDAVFYLLGRAYQRTIHGYSAPLSPGESMALWHTMEAMRCLLLSEQNDE